MGLYLPEGWPDFDYICRNNESLIIVLGGRGTGKTFGVLKKYLLSNRKFVLMRRTDRQVDVIKEPELSPINPVADDLGLDIKIKSVADHIGGMFYGDDPVPFSFVAALSTFGSVRGFDGSEVKDILFDEFIRQPEERRSIKNEGSSFRNAYETINRNRELPPLNQDPVKIMMLSNTNTIDSDILLNLGVVDDIYDMQIRGIREYHDAKRSIAIYLLTDSPISAKKRNTFLYRLGGDKDHDAMALDNTFVTSYGKTLMQHPPIREFKPVCQMGNIYLYVHKSRPMWYASLKRYGSFNRVYENNDQGRKLFSLVYSSLDIWYARRAIYFDKISTEMHFLSWV